MNLSSFLSEIGLAESILALILASMPVIAGFIKAWNTTQVEIALLPIHQRVLHDFKMSLLFSFFMIGALTLLSQQLAKFVTIETLNVIAYLSFSLWSISFLVVISHGLSLLIKVRKVKFFKIFRSMIIVSFTSLLATIIFINATLFIENPGTNNLTTILITELVLLYVFILMIPYYLGQINKSGYYYEIKKLSKEEKDLLLENMVLINVIKPDIQILSPISENPNLSPNLFPVYIYYVQSDVLEKINRKKKLKKQLEISDVIWNSTITQFNSYVKSELNLNNSRALDIQIIKRTFLNLDLYTLRRALTRGKKMKFSLTPSLLGAGFLAFIQMILTYIPFNSEIKFIIGIVSGIIFLALLLNIRREYLITLHFVDLVEESIFQKQRNLRDNNL